MESSAATSDQAMQSVAEAMRDAAGAATGHVTAIKGTVSKVGSQSLQAVSRLAYTSVYMLSYGVVYTAIFTYSLPGKNPLMNGLRDGARAAMDELKKV
jgi:hypothetical protein